MARILAVADNLEGFHAPHLLSYCPFAAVHALKIVLAPNALKGSCTASAAANALAVGVARALPDAELVQVPVADGGDGLVDVLTHALRGESRPYRVTGPGFNPVDAALTWVGVQRTAVIEMALASGLALLAESDRDPTATTTLGTGELLRHALDLGAKRLVVGVGGSATNDGGTALPCAMRTVCVVYKTARH